MYVYYLIMYCCYYNFMFISSLFSFFLFLYQSKDTFRVLINNNELLNVYILTLNNFQFFHFFFKIIYYIFVIFFLILYLFNNSIDYLVLNFYLIIIIFILTGGI